MQVGVVGASGAVGNEIVRLLEMRKFPLRSLRLFASERSIGKTVLFREEKIALELLSLDAMRGLDLVFFAAGSKVSKEWIPKTSSLCIDSSSAFRESVPLIIPEINAHAMRNHSGVIASPNCAATILLLPLAPLHRKFGVKRIIASTYQAASGGGAALLEHLTEETRAVLNGCKFESPLPFPYAFNLYPHNSLLHEDGYVEEEVKIEKETRKILEDDSIGVSMTCVRVPVQRAHSVSANVEFRKAFRLEEIYGLIQQAPGVTLFEDRARNRFATPMDATGRDEVLCGRFRLDRSGANALEYWAVGDQLLKGAALNAVQIAERVPTK